jgi:hypothetical protein
MYWLIILDIIIIWIAAGVIYTLLPDTYNCIWIIPVGATCLFLYEIDQRYQRSSDYVEIPSHV